MAAGIPTVVSPVGMATELVEHNVNGFWARTPEEWLEAPDGPVSHVEDRRRFSEETRKTRESRYSLQI
ncbi:MAG: glycosyltransferase [Candidatus Acidiferrales bacterium]|jgi:glycosyltransferase involved in cell wall biosynthesis